MNDSASRSISIQMSSSRPELRFTATATNDLLVILTFTNLKWGEPQLLRYQRLLETGFERIGAFPLVGVVDHPSRPAIRRRVIEHHVVFYEILDSDTIVVLRVLHKRMDLSEWETKEWNRE